MPEVAEHKFTVNVINPETNTAKDVTIVRHTPQKGRGKDNPKYQPENFDTMPAAEVTDFLEGLFGKAKIGKILKPRFNQILATLTGEATTKTAIKDGKEVEEIETDLDLIAADFGKMFAVLSPRGETLMSLTKRLNEIESTELPEILDRLFSVEEGTEDYKKLRALAASLKEERADIRASIADKKKKTEDKEEVAAVVV